MRKDPATVKRVAMVFGSMEYFKHGRSPFYLDEDIENAKLFIDLYNDMKPGSETSGRLMGELDAENTDPRLDTRAGI